MFWNTLFGRKNPAPPPHLTTPLTAFGRSLK